EVGGAPLNAPFNAPCSSGGRCSSTLPAPAVGGAPPLPGELPRPPILKKSGEIPGPRRAEQVPPNVPTTPLGGAAVAEMFRPVWLVEELKPHVFWRFVFWLWRARKIREMQKGGAPASK